MQNYPKRYLKDVREGFKQTSSPMQVAEVILNAIKSEKPNTRYLVGNDAVAIKERKKNSSDFELERWMKESHRRKRFCKEVKISVTFSYSSTNNYKSVAYLIP